MVADAEVRVPVREPADSIWTSRQLAEGINLAPLATPMTTQASEVHKLTTRRTDLYHTRYYLYQVPYSNAADPV